MSGTDVNNISNDGKIFPEEILLQVKALQDIRTSIRKNAFRMKKSRQISDINKLPKEIQDLKRDCQKDDKNDGKKRIIWIWKGDTKKRYFTNFMSEFLGTGLLMFLGCMGCAPQADNPPAVHHMSSLSFGLVILLIIQVFGHISGAHLNPAVTISTILFKMLSPVMGLVYIVAQFIGATFGMALLKILMPQEWVVPGFCATKPHLKTTPIQALAIETIITSVLIMVCCGVWDKRNATKQDSVAARFGFIVAAIGMVAGPITGASMNTARSFAPALLEADYTSQWIYWIGPNVGALIGSGIYSFLFKFDEEEENIRNNVVMNEEDESAELNEIKNMTDKLK